MQLFTNVFGYLIYGAQAIVAIWGFFCVVLVWMRVAQKRFRSEAEQSAFIAEIEQPLADGNYDAAMLVCRDDPRALPQLVQLALSNRHLGFVKVRQLVLDRLQRDILSDLEHRLSWVYTVIKAAPMLGLLGTVAGMMGAFGKLSTAEQVEPSQLASDIMLALITTLVGLSIAVPLVIAANGINVQIRKMEELIAVGLTQFFEIFRTSDAAEAKAGPSGRKVKA
jgi:biopolymer transport protein ExbB/TolQ